MKNFPAIGLAVVVIALLINATFYIIPEGSQALVLQFGRIVSAEIDSGLHLKTPFIQSVEFLEKRVLNWDGIPERVPTLDKKYIIVDTTARYRISDPISFRRSLENEKNAQSKIKNVIDSATRDVISRNNLVEAVRNTNSILDQEELRSAQREAAEISGTLDMLEEEITGEIAPVAYGREKLSRDIIDIAKPLLNDYGIELIDVQLRRIAYEESVQEEVYNRMISERQRIAEKIRSVGKGEQAKILGKMSLDLQEIESKAYRTVQEIKGVADAEAIGVYAEAVNKDQDFYEFSRLLEAYQRGLQPDAQMILSTKTKFLELFTNGPKQ